MSRLRFSAWITQAPASAASFQANAPLLTRVYPLWYDLSPGGLPKARADAAPAWRLAVQATARASAVAVWPCICNGDPLTGAFDPMVLRLVLGDRSTRRMHHARLLALAEADGAQGVSLSYQGLGAGDRPAFSLLVEELCAVFHSAGLKVGVTVLPGSQAGGEVFDLARLGAAADLIQVRCYRPQPLLPGPLSPPDWVRGVMNGALGAVDAEKLECVMPGHGYRWAPGAAPQRLDWAAWDDARTATPPERRDPATVELTLNAPGQAVWYNDSISLAAKLYQTRDLGLDQAALQILGPEDPRLWALLDTLPDPYLRKST